MSEGSVPGVAQPGRATSVPAVGAPIVQPPPGPWANQSSRPAAVGTAVATDATRHPFSWNGSPWELARVCLMNTVLAVLTLGIYSFWGRTEIRRRLWSSVRLYGEPLAYHGTPKELMKGFFAVLGAVLAPLFVVGILVVVYYGQASAVFTVYQFGLFAVLYPILTAIAFYRGRRYRLSRTSWRGVRGSLTGSSGAYAAFNWLTLCAVPLTLFWLIPYRAVALQRQIVDDTTLGNARLQFDGSATPVYKRYALLWFGTVVLFAGAIALTASTIGARYQPDNPRWMMTITSRDVAKVVGAIIGAVVIWSLISSFYFARLYNYMAHSTIVGKPPNGVEPARFHLDVTGKRIIWLFVTNLLITYLSLYILRPVAMARTMKYYAENLSIVGPFDPAALGQNTSVFDPSGEGLAQAFDLDAF